MERGCLDPRHAIHICNVAIFACHCIYILIVVQRANGTAGSTRTNHRGVETQIVKRFLYRQFMSDYRSLTIYDFTTPDGVRHSSITLGALFDITIPAALIARLNALLSVPSADLPRILSARNCQSANTTSRVFSFTHPAQHPINCHPSVRALYTFAGTGLLIDS